MLTFEGQNFGLHMLRMYKDLSIYHNIKNAVFVGKDRQSDYLSYDHVLLYRKFYKVVRIPKLILRHTENAKTQQSIILPTSIETIQMEMFSFQTQLHHAYMLLTDPQLLNVIL